MNELQYSPEIKINTPWEPTEAEIEEAGRNFEDESKPYKERYTPTYLYYAAKHYDWLDPSNKSGFRDYAVEIRQRAQKWHAWLDTPPEKRPQLPTERWQPPAEEIEEAMRDYAVPLPPEAMGLARVYFRTPGFIYLMAKAAEEFGGFDSAAELVKEARELHEKRKNMPKEVLEEEKRQMQIERERFQYAIERQKEFKRHEALQAVGKLNIPQNKPAVPNIAPNAPAAPKAA